MFKEKSKFIRIRAVAVFFAVISAFFAVSSNPIQAASELLDIDFSLNVTPGGPLGEKQGDLWFYTASLTLNSPQTLKVGDTISTGPRSSATITGFGLGLISGSQAKAACVGNSTVKDCRLAVTVPSKKEFLTSGDPLSAVIALDARMREDLGIVSEEGVSLIHLIPYIQINNHSTVKTFTANVIRLDGSSVTAGEVLGIFTNTAQAANIPKNSLTFGPLLAGGSNSAATSIGITKEQPLFFDMQALINQVPGISEFKQGDCIQFDENFCLPVTGVYIGAVTPKHESSGSDPKCSQYSFGDIALNRIIYQTCSSLDAKTSVIPIHDIQPGVSKPLKLDWSRPVREAAGANVATADGVSGANVFTAYLFFELGIDKSSPEGYSYPPLRVDGASVNISVRIFEDEAAANAFNNDPNRREPLQGQQCGLNCGTNATVKPPTLLEGVLIFVNTILQVIVSIITELLSFLLRFIGPFIEALLAIRTYTNQFADVIYPAWEIFRNLANILFILAIIATGLATVFRIGGWQAKDILVKLILGAILINFSLLIAQTVLGVADTVQNQFLPPDTGTIRLLADELIVKGSRSMLDQLGQSDGYAFGSFGPTVRIVTNFIMAFVAFIAFLAIALFLAIRLVFLWLLLMTAPLPYVTMVLPLTRSLTKRWWSNFIKYAFMTPAMAFMLNLAALIAKTYRDRDDLIPGLAGGRYAQLDKPTETLMFSLGLNVVILVFLFMSLKVASMFGAESGGLIEKVSDKGWRAAIGGPKMAGQYLNLQKQKAGNFMANNGGVLGRLGAAVLSPVATGQAIQRKWADNRKKVELETAKQADYAAKHVISGKGLKTAYNNLKLNLGSLARLKSFKDRFNLAQARQSVLSNTQRDNLETEWQKMQDRLHRLQQSTMTSTEAQIMVDSVDQQLLEAKEELKKLQTDIDYTRASGGNTTLLDRAKADLEFKEMQLKDLRATLSTRKDTAGPDGFVAVGDLLSNSFVQDSVNSFKRDLDARMRDVSDKIREDDANRRAVGWTRTQFADDAEWEQAHRLAQAEFQKLQALRSNSRLPESFVETDLRHQRVTEKKKELEGDDDFDSLFLRFQQAMYAKDKDLAMAAYEKIEQNGDTQDFLNKLGYDADAEGKKRFTEEVVMGKLGYDYTQAMLIASESDKRNKSNKIYNLAWTQKVDDEGKRIWRKDSRGSWAPQHKKAVEGAMGEGSLRDAMSKLTTDFTFKQKADGNVELSEPAKELLSRIGNDRVALGEVERYFNFKVASQIASTDPRKRKISGNWKQAMVDAGVKPEIIKAISVRAGNPSQVV